MNIDDVKSWSKEILRSITHAHTAHSGYANTQEDTVRFHDRSTPYIVHPLWCAASLLQEPLLPLEFRRMGSMALLWHDTLEDTALGLPSDAPEKVIELVQGMTFSSFVEEQEHLWDRPLEIRLLKLYDKVSNLLDGAWMKGEKWNAYVRHTLRLTEDVEHAYGGLNVVKIARSIAVIKVDVSV